VELATLVQRVVEFGVGVDVLSPADEHLEALGQARARAMRLRQRAHQLWVIDDERGLSAPRLDVVANELVQKTGRKAWRATLDVGTRAPAIEEASGLFGVERIGGWKRRVALGRLLHVGARQLHVDRQALERPTQHQRRSAVWRRHPQRLRVTSGARRQAQRRSSQELKELLGHWHQVVVVMIGPVELDGRELGRVALVDVLVAELLADLVDALCEAAGHQHLQVQLGRDAHDHVQVQCVLVRVEGPGGGAASLHLQHWRLDLQEAQLLLAEFAQCRDDAGTNLEHFARLLVHREVQRAVAIARLEIDELHRDVSQVRR